MNPFHKWFVNIRHIRADSLKETWDLCLNWIGKSDYLTALKVMYQYLSEPAKLYAIKEKLHNTTDMSKRIEMVNAIPHIESNQKYNEITTLLDRVKGSQNLCEIGTKFGGTLLLLMLFSQPDSIVISVDLENSARLRRRLQILKYPAQQLFIFQGDSQLETTKQKVIDVLSGNQLDFLFIDGDHSYEGVKRDFELYNDLVKHDGLIAFHDIEESHFVKFGKETRTIVGGVPKYWEELASSDFKTEAFVQSKDQDGYGIGLIHWQG